MNGTPPASFTCAWDFTREGMASLFSMFVRNDVESAAISSAPASAVPSEAPRLVAVF